MNRTGRDATKKDFNEKKLTAKQIAAIYELYAANKNILAHYSALIATEAATDSDMAIFADRLTRGRALAEVVDILGLGGVFWAAYNVDGLNRVLD